MSEIPNWRRGVLLRLDVTLTLFQLILSAAFLAISVIAGSLYFRGVGIGLTIAWVTSAVVLVYRRTTGV